LFLFGSASQRVNNALVLMTNKTIIILVVILVLALGLLSFSVYYYMTKRGETEVVEQPAPQPITSQPIQPSVPAVISENFNKVFGDARAAMDPEICSQLATSAEVRDCTDKVNLLIAYRGRDISLCRGVFNDRLRDGCYVNLGLSLGIEYCKYLTDPLLQQSCEADQNIE
jgi:hypothetical protein